MHYGTKQNVLENLMTGDSVYTARIKRCVLINWDGVPIYTEPPQGTGELFINDYYSTPEEVLAVHSREERIGDLLRHLGAEDGDAVEIAVIECNVEHSGLVFSEFMFGYVMYWSFTPDGKAVRSMRPEVIAQMVALPEDEERSWSLFGPKDEEDSDDEDNDGIVEEDSDNEDIDGIDDGETDDEDNDGIVEEDSDDEGDDGIEEEENDDEKGKDRVFHEIHDDNEEEIDMANENELGVENDVDAIESPEKTSLKKDRAADAPDERMRKNKRKILRFGKNRRAEKEEEARIIVLPTESEEDAKTEKAD